MFFKVKTTEEVLDLVQGFQPVGEEIVPLDRAFCRVLSREIVSPEDLPGFPRTSVDGYAIRAKDSFGATESLPALLEIVGEVGMGQIPAITVAPGQAVKIATGGMVPKGADGVVMVEYCHLMDQTTLEVSRAISPQENVIQPDDDFRKGAAVLRSGWRLRSQDVGVLAGLGVTEVAVHKKPRVAIISTGDEVIPVQEKPRPGAGERHEYLHPRCILCDRRVPSRFPWVCAGMILSGSGTWWSKASRARTPCGSQAAVQWGPGI